MLESGSADLTFVAGLKGAVIDRVFAEKQWQLDEFFKKDEYLFRMDTSALLVFMSGF